MARRYHELRRHIRFWHFSNIPAVRLIPSYQHIWNPFSAQVVTDQDHADIFLTRLTVAW